MDLRFWAATDTGRVRDHNEDNFLVDKNLQLFVVCDGMGGHAAGEVASAVCVRTVREVIAAEAELLATLRENPDDQAAIDKLQAIMRRAVKTGNARIFEMAREDPSRQGMGTTCVALVLAGNRGFVGHVGDSRMYRLRNDEVEQITDDHSLLNEMIRQGQVAPGTTEEEFQHQNAVTRAVGVRESVNVDSLVIDLEAGDRLMMCSDGLSEYLGDADQMRAVVGSGAPKDTSSACIDLANESGGKDNITVVVVDCQSDSISDGVSDSYSVEGQRQADKDTAEIEHETDQGEVVDLLRQTPYFHYLSPEELKQISEMANRVDADAGQIVVSASEDADRLFLILDGSVSLTVDDQQVSMLKAGEHFGEMALVDAQDEHDTTLEAEANERSEFLTIKRDQFVGLLRTSPGLAIKLLWNFVQVFADRLQAVPPEFRYLPEELEAEPEAIADLARNQEDEPPQNDDPRSDKPPNPEQVAPSSPSARSAQKEKAPAEKEDSKQVPDPVEVGDDADELRETVNLQALDPEEHQLEAAPVSGATPAEPSASRDPNDTLPPVDDKRALEQAGEPDEESPSVRFNSPESPSPQSDDADVGLSSGTYDQDLLESRASGLDETTETSVDAAASESPEESSPGSVRINRPDSTDSDKKPDSAALHHASEPSTADDEADDDDDDDEQNLRSTIQIDWGDEADGLEIPSSSAVSEASDSEQTPASKDGPSGDNISGGEDELAETAEFDADRDALHALKKDSSRSIKDELRDRLSNRPAPQAGILEKASGKNGEPDSEEDSKGAPPDVPDEDVSAPEIDNGSRKLAGEQDESEDKEKDKSKRNAIAGESTVHDRGEESKPQPEEPKIMISPDLMADVEDGD